MKNKTLFASIWCAIKGFGKAFKTEKNFAYYAVIWALALCADFYFNASAVEHCIVTVLGAAVFSAEFINTAIERISNLINPDFSKEIADIKDIAASAVLFFGIAFFAVQAIIIFPKL